MNELIYRPADAYMVLTPVGVVFVQFPEEGGAVATGQQLAKDLLGDALKMCTGRYGQSLSLDGGLEPIELESFFDAQAHDMSVFPPMDDVVDLQPRE